MSEIPKYLVISRHFNIPSSLHLQGRNRMGNFKLEGGIPRIDRKYYKLVGLGMGGLKHVM